jgi:hypothetical protein
MAIYKFTALVVMTAMMCVACGGGVGSKSGSVSSGSTDPNSPAPSPSPTPQTVNGPAPLTFGAVAGNWKSPACNTATIAGTYSQQAMVLSGSNYSENFAYSVNADCSSPYYTDSRVGTFTLPSLNSVITGATDILFTFSKRTYTVHIAATVAYWNQIKVCGFTDWVINVAKTVPPECAGVDPATFSNILGVSGNLLYFANGTRTALDTANPLIKQ